MHQRPRTVLRQLIRHYGPAVYTDSKRVESFLRDLCGEHYREIFLIVHAQEQHVPKELLAAGHLAGEPALWQRLSRRLQDRLSFTAEAADWAVESWAMALDIAPARRRYPLALRPILSFFSHSNGTRLWQAAKPVHQYWRHFLANIGVQWTAWKHPLLDNRQRMGAALLTFVLFAAIVASYGSDSITTVARSLFLRQRGETRIEEQQPLSPQRALEWLVEVYAVPRQVRIDAEQVSIRAEPEPDAQTVALIRSPGGVITIDGYTPGGNWVHISDPVQGWIEQHVVTHRTAGENGARGIDVYVTPMLGQVSESGLRVRQAPGLDSQILGTLSQEESVLILATTLDRQWLQIVEPMRGWVSSDYIRLATP